MSRSSSGVHGPDAGRAGWRGSLSTGVRWSLRPRREATAEYGRVQAISLDTRKTVWIERQRAPQSTGALATAGRCRVCGRASTVRSSLRST